MPPHRAFRPWKGFLVVTVLLLFLPKTFTLWVILRVAPQGRLANEIASRPLFAENLDAVGAIIKIIARNGEFVAAWREIDAVNPSVDAQGRLALKRASRPC